ncbi:hypothetical protein D3C85_1669250 [compost metagenome]
MEHARLLRALAGEHQQTAHAACSCGFQGLVTKQASLAFFSRTRFEGPAHSRRATAPFGVCSCISTKHSAASRSFTNSCA